MFVGFFHLREPAGNLTNLRNVGSEGDAKIFTAEKSCSPLTD